MSNKLQDYCVDTTYVYGGERGEDDCSMNPTIQWHMIFSNGEKLISNFGFLTKDAEGTFFYLNESDVEWIEKQKESNSDGIEKHLTSLETFSMSNPGKRVYLREIRSSSVKNIKMRRVFTDEVLEILPIVLRQQGRPIEKSDDRLKQYHDLWKSSGNDVFHSIDFEEFHRFLETFDVDKSLITIVPDPVYDGERLQVIENGRNMAIALVCPDGRCVYETSQAILLIFLYTVTRRNWNVEDCDVHPNCNEISKKGILAAMRDIMKEGENSFIAELKLMSILNPWLTICESQLRRQCSCFGSTFHLDISGANGLVNSSVHYAKLAEVYSLPTYCHSFDNSGTFSIGDPIPAWIARFLLLTGWANQFFDKESSDLKKLVFGALPFKVPKEKMENVWSFLNNLLEQDNEKYRSGDRNSKMLRAAQERKEKLQKRKALNKQRKMTPSAREEKNKGTSSDVNRKLVLDSNDIQHFILENGAEIIKKKFPELDSRQLTPEKGQEIFHELLNAMPNISDDQKNELLRNINFPTNPLKWIQFCNLFTSAILQRRTEALMASASLANGEQSESADPQISTHNSTSESVSPSIEITPKMEEEEVPKNPEDTKKTPEESKCCAKCNRTSEMCNEAKKELKMVQNKLEKCEKKAKRTDDLEKKMKEMEKEMKKLKMFEEKARRIDEVEKELEIGRKEVKNLEKKVKEKDLELEKSKRENEKLKAEIGRMKIENKENEKSKNRIITEFTMAQEQAVVKISSLEEEIRQLKIENESLQDMKNSENSENRKCIEKLQTKNENLGLKDSECLVCFGEMKPEEKTLQCEHCKKITHLECASQWLKVARSCPHCRRKQLDPNEFPALC